MEGILSSKTIILGLFQCLYFDYSCCVDEITAEHVGADSLIHFGHACLSLNKRLPTLYVFKNLNIEQESFLSAFRKNFSDEKEKILLISDLKYNQSTGRLLRARN